MTLKHLNARSLSRGFGFTLLAACVWADAAALKNIGYTPLAGGEGELVLTLDEAPPAPTVFATDEPARLVIDLPGTRLEARERSMALGAGVGRAVTAVEAGGRTRVVVDLVAMAAYDSRVEGNTVVVRLGRPASTAVAGVAAAPIEVQNVDFRRGREGGAKISVAFSKDFANADLKVEGSRIIVDFVGAGLAEGQARRLDVTDFATPVQFMEVTRRGANARLEILAGSDFEHMAYQSGSNFVVEVKPVEKRTTASRIGELPTYTGQPATFNFQDIPVRSVLQLIADVSQLNVVVADSVSGNVTLRLINVPWDQALDIILQAKGLDKRRSGSVIWVAPTKEIADREQAIEDARLAIEERAPLITEQIPLNYALAEEVAKLLTEDTKGNGSQSAQGQQLNNSGFLSQRGRLGFDVRTNTLLVSDIRSRIEALRELVAILDRPVPQVQIEARVVTASENTSRELGARFGLSGAVEDSDGNLLATSGSNAALDQMVNVALINRLVEYRPSGLPVAAPSEQRGGGLSSPTLADRLNVNLPASANAPRFGFAVLGADYLLDLELQALETEGRVEIVTRPQVITSSQRPANVVQGSRVPYTRQVISDGGSTTVTEFIEAGLRLGVTPTISPDGRVFLQIQVQDNSLAGFSPDGAPIINLRETNTSVLIDNGQTVVLGGISTEERADTIRKTPGLGSVPVLGNLFKSRSRTNSKNELLIFVTPRVLQPGS
jgi:type IV pilus assembly protein PilQ